MNCKNPIIFLAQSAKFEIETSSYLSFPDKFAKKIGELHSFKEAKNIAQQGTSLGAENVYGTNVTNAG